MKYCLIIIILFIAGCDNPNEAYIFGCLDQNACNYNPNANVSDNDTCQYFDDLENCCLVIEQDECNICNGDGIAEGTCDCDANTLDECGICNGGGIQEDECDCNGNVLDCEGTCGGLIIEDCLGVCNGDASLDGCGVCNGDNTSCQGCDGIVNSGLELDECGICDGEGVEDWACDCNGNVLDCEGTCGGDAEFDECGVCNNNPSDDCTNCELEWHEVWTDNFDETINIQDNWNFEVWGPGMVNNEEQAYTASTNNAYVENGNLVIKALRENLDLNNDGTPDTEYTSARLTTQNKRFYVYENNCGDCDRGKIKIEVSAKLPTGVGTWPAIWMMPNNSEYGSWPNSGEIDIMEHVGYDSNTIHSSVHNATNSENLGGTNQTSSQVVSNVENSYHTYGLIWSNEEIITFIDNEENIVLDYNHPEQTNYELWPYDKEFFIILNLAIGGIWGGINGIDNDSFPQYMYIDYVKVSELRCSEN